MKKAVLALAAVAVLSMPSAEASVLSKTKVVALKSVRVAGLALVLPLRVGAVALSSGAVMAMDAGKEELDARVKQIREVMAEPDPADEPKPEAEPAKE